MQGAYVRSLNAREMLAHHRWRLAKGRGMGMEDGLGWIGYGGGGGHAMCNMPDPALITTAQSAVAELSSRSRPSGPGFEEFAALDVAPSPSSVAETVPSLESGGRHLGLCLRRRGTHRPPHHPLMPNSWYRELNSFDISSLSMSLANAVAKLRRSAA